MSELQARVSQLNSSTINHKSDEASRKAKALREIDGDRDEVKVRVEREKRSREYREKLRKEAEEKAKLEEEAAEEVAREGEPGANHSANRNGEEEGENQDDDGMDEDETLLGGGRRLGK